MKFRKDMLFIAAALVTVLGTPVLAKDAAPYVITIKDHKFEPAEIKVTANTPVVLNVKNMDASAEEFDSDDLNAEKVIVGNGEGIIHINPLKPGRYEFEGEYNSKTARGVVIAE